MHEYEYTVSSFNIWSSFDYGTVMADNYKEARAKAIAKLNEDFAKANDALKHSDNTKDFTIEFDKDNVSVQLKTKSHDKRTSI